MTLLITGGCGFIGSALARHLVATTHHEIVNLDCLTYAASEDSTQALAANPRYRHEKADINDAEAVEAAFRRHQPAAVVHLAAESHVDRSIDGPAAFVHTNVLGTFNLLQSALRHFERLPAEAQAAFRFHHVSTDEVYGSLGAEGLFREDTPYAPNSPYSATKAASDHLVRAWQHTYGLPTLITNCSNNYGPWQFPEKLIPLMILNAVEGKPLPVYGEGANVRDWLFVEDHAEALHTVLTRGRVGEVYNIGGHNEQRNIDVVRTLCTLLDELHPEGAPHERLITFVTDRPGHDARYAIDAGKIARELGWRPRETFASGLRKTVSWYLDHLDWCRAIRARTYAGQRLGLRQAS